MQAENVVFKNESNIYYRNNYYGYNHSYSCTWDYSYIHSEEDMGFFIFIALTWKQILLLTHEVGKL